MNLLKIICLLFLSSSLLAQKTFMSRVKMKSSVLMEKILSNDFLRELKNGTLPKNKFDYFEHQDKLYNYRYSNTLAILSARRDAQLYVASFLRQASLDTLNEWVGPLPDDMGQCPDCFAYSNFEEQSASVSLEIGIAAIAPCYVVYWIVGQNIAQGVHQNNPYYEWILKYSDHKFGTKVAMLETMINEIALRLNERDQQKMEDTYLRTVNYELLFWESAYKLATWSPKHGN